MRALHLIGMRAAGGGKLRFHPSDDAPLVLPSWFSESDREIILAFYQQVLSDDTLPRIEVDWYRSLVDADRGFLRNAHERHGSGDYLVVVKVRREGADLREILAQPELRPFQHVAVAAGDDLGGESLGRLSELTRFVTLTAEELYEEMADELSLRPDGNALIQPLVRTLLNPILVLETYNALVDVHAEGVAHDEQRKAVWQRILGRLFNDLPPQVAVALAALALRGVDGLTSVVPEPQRAEAMTALRARMLVRDGRLVRWAQWLEDEGMHEVINHRIHGIVQPRERKPKGAQRVLEWLGHEDRPERDPIDTRLTATFRLLKEGQIGRVRDELMALEHEIESPSLTDETRADFWDAVGRLRAAEARWDEAEAALRRSIELQKRSGVGLFRRALTMDVLARGLRDNGRWQEAEPLFREGILFMGESGFAPQAQGIMMDHLARGLRDNGRWQEAEPLFREALHLKSRGRADSYSRGVTMLELAHGLRKNDRREEAEPLFVESQRLLEEAGTEQPAVRAGWLRTYGLQLRQAGRVEEASRIEALAEEVESRDQGEPSRTSAAASTEQVQE